MAAFTFSCCFNRGYLPVTPRTLYMTVGEYQQHVHVLIELELHQVALGMGRDHGSG